MQPELLQTGFEKLRTNLIVGNEVHTLTGAENRALKSTWPFMTTYWIRPKIVERWLYWPEKSSAVINFQDGGKISSFANHSSVKFVVEVLRNIPLEDTTLYRNMSMSEVSRREIAICRGGKRVRVRLNNHENLEAYYAKCQALISSVRKHGIKTLTPDEIFPDDSWFPDRNIGLAITSGGDIVHYRKGHHRLAIAQQLKLARVPVEVLLVSAEFLRKQLNPRPLQNVDDMLEVIGEYLFDRVMGAQNFIS